MAEKQTATAYPLAWPDGWPRTPYHRREHHRFGGRTYPLTFERARQGLFDELGRLGARNIVLSTNIPLRQDGPPYAGAALKRMDDPGVAVYFTLKDRNLSMARDGYLDIAANMRSLAMAIDGLRQLERHGGSYMMEKAFSGFMALPPPMKPQRPWRAVLRFQEIELPTADLVESRFRALSMKAHPDTGGSHDAMAELNAARAEALREIGNG